MVSKDYLDPEGYWTDPDDCIHRMSGEQDIIGRVVTARSGNCSVHLNRSVCSDAELTLTLDSVSDIAKKNKPSRNGDD